MDAPDPRHGVRDRGAPLHPGRQSLTVQRRTRLELQDFTIAQIASLNARHGCGPLFGKPGGLRGCTLLLGGHPYLTRTAFHRLAQQSVDLDQSERDAPREDGPFGAHLRRLLFCLDL